MKLYLAAPYSHGENIRLLAAWITTQKHTVVSTWHATPDDALDADLFSEANRPRSRELAQRDLDEIHSADALLLFRSSVSRGGKDFETGYAYALGKPIHVIGQPYHLFHCLPGIAWWDSLADWLAAHPA